MLEPSALFDRRHRPGACRRRSWLATTALAGLAVVSGAAPSVANPTGGQVAAGSATIAPARGTTLDITQSSQNVVLNWQSFSIGKGETTQFFQPNSSAVALNRVLGADPSAIAGQLKANGDIILVNPSGIVFSKGSQVDVNSLVATTSNIGDRAFMSGSLHFDTRSSDPNAVVVNKGQISVAATGLAALVAPNVANAGVIDARLGRVVLGGASAFSVDLYGDGLISFDVSDKIKEVPVTVGGKSATALVSNTGQISADGGHVLLTADEVDGIVTDLVDAGGTIQATSVGAKTGRVDIQSLGGGTAQISGLVDVSGLGAGQIGGYVDVTAPKVALAGSARIDARGDAGGGKIELGGGFHGADPDLADAEITTVAAGAFIDASAVHTGDGGTVAIWSDRKTRFAGTVLATGGALFGNGGFVETSGENLRAVGGFVDALAPHGRIGTWLLDPKNVTVATGGTGTIAGATFANTPTADETIDPATIDAATANVDLQANNDITITNAIAMTHTGVGLELEAGRSILVDANISTTSGAVTLIANQTVANGVVNGDRDTGAAVVSILNGATIDTGTGAISLTIGTGAGLTNNASGDLNAPALNATGAVTIANQGAGNVILGGVVANSLAVTATGNEILDGGTYTIGASPQSFGAVTLEGALTFGQATKFTGAVRLGAATTIASTGGVTFQSTLDGAETLGITGDAVFDGAVGTTALASLSVSGTSGLGADITTTGIQTYTGAATLTTDATLTGGTVGFGSTLNGAHNLAITGDATFGSTVGATTGLTSLSVSGTSGIGGDVKTTGNEAFTGAVTLNADAAFDATGAASAVALGAVTGGAHNLSVTAGTGGIGLNGVVTTGTLALATTGTETLGAGTYTVGTSPQSFGTVTLDGAITLGQATTFTGAVTLGAATTIASTGGVTFQSTLDGAEALGITGNAVFDGAVGATPLTSLSVTGTTGLGANVTTTGNETFTGAVTLSANAALDASGGASAVTLGAVAGGAHNLGVTAGTGGIGLGGVVTTGTLTLVTTGTETLNAGTYTVGAGPQSFGAVTLNGAIVLGQATEFTGAVTLGAATTIASTGGVTFQSTLDGAETLGITGNAVFDGAVGSTNPLTSLGVSGTSTLDNNVATTGNQTFTGAATLDATATLAGGTIKFGSTLDGGSGLTVTGNAVFKGAVGVGTPLTDISVSGTTALNGGTVTTSGDQGYTGAVTLGANTTLNTTLATFGSSVNGGFTLALSTRGIFDGPVGGTTPLASLSVGGPTELNGGSVATTGTQTYTGAVDLLADATLTGSAITFQSTVDGAFALGIVGNATFDAAVGGATPLASVDVSGTTAVAGAVNTTGDQTLTGTVTLTGNTSFVAGAAASAIALGEVTGSGDAVNLAAGTGGITLHGMVAGSLTAVTTGTETLNTGTYTVGASPQSFGRVTLDGAIDLGQATEFTGAVTLGAATTLTSTGGVTFQSTLDGAKSLAITGNAAFDGAVGGGAPLASLSVSGTTGFAADISTTGNQTYTGAATLGGATTLTGATVTFGSTLDGAFALAVAGNAVFEGAVGSIVGLQTLDISGTTNFADTGDVGGNTVASIGSQTYTGAVTLGANAAASANGGVITFVSTIDGAHALALSGSVTFEGKVGATAALASVTEQSAGGTTSFADTGDVGGNVVATTGIQSYGNLVSLGANTALTASSVHFAGSIEGAQSLTVTGNAVFGGTVGDLIDLSSVTVTGTSALNGGLVFTSGSQDYAGAVTLGANTSLENFDTTAGISVGAVAGGAHTLAFQIGSAGLTLNGVAAGSLTVAALGGATPTETLNAGTYTIGAGPQSFGSAALPVALGGTLTLGEPTSFAGAVTLGANTTTANTVGNAAGSVTFLSTVDGGHALTVGGPAIFDAAVGSSAALASLTVDGTSALGANITTTGAQTYTGAATLGANATLAGSTIAFGATLDGGEALTVTGNATFDGAVGGVTPLASVAVSGSTGIDASIATTAAQTYTGAVTLTGTAELTGSTVTFQSTLDGAHALTVNGAGVFDGAVGGTAALASLVVGGTAALDGAAITTTGAQTYDAAVTLGAATALHANLVGFDSTLNGAEALTVTGNASFSGAVGGVAALASLAVSGTAALDTALIATAGTQHYSGAATLGANADLTASAVTFGSTLDGGQALTVTGNAVFDGPVGSTTALASLGVSGTAALESTGIATTGFQTYTGAVTLGANQMLAGSTVTFDATLDGAHTLGITGAADFAGAVGAAHALTSIAISGTSTLAGASVATTGTQTYSSAATLGSDNALTASLVTFGATVDGAHALSVTGGVVFDGAVGATTALASIAVSGTSGLGGTSVATTGAQTYSGAATLGTDNALTASLVTFGATLDGAHALAVTGNAVFDGAVGHTAALAALSVSGTTGLDGTSVATTGSQTYTGAATLGTDNALTASLVTFGATVDGAHALGITGNAVFDGAVGSTVALASLSVSGTSGLDGIAVSTTGTQTYTGAATLGTDNTLTASLVTFGATLDGAQALAIAGNAVFDGAVGSTTALAALGVSGTTGLSGVSVVTTGAQTFTGAATLGTDNALSASLVTFGATLDGAHALGITGDAVFDGRVGATAALASLGISGTSVLNGLGVSTTGVQDYAGAATLGTDNALTASLVTFGATVDGAHALGITGNAVFDGAVGSNTALAALNVTGTSGLDGTSVATTGAQTYTGAATLGTDNALAASLVTFGATLDGAHTLGITGNAAFDGAVGSIAPLTALSVSGSTALGGGVATGTTQTYTGAVTLEANVALDASTVTFEQTVDGAHALGITGNAVLDAPVGGTTALTSFSVSGTSALDGSSVATTGAQTYTGATTIGTDNTLTASLVTFGATLDGAQNLAIAGNAVFEGAVGSNAALTTLSISGTSGLDGTSIATTGSQSFTGATTLGADNALSASLVTFGAALDGAHALAVTGNAVFDGAVGHTAALAALSVSGTTGLDGTSVATTGSQTYTGAATLGTGNALTASLVTFGATVDGAHALGITGNAVFDGAVGSTVALASLSVSGTSGLDGIAVSTTGTQTYTGAATLGTDNTLTASLVTFGATLDGAQALAVAGNAVFDGAVGSTTALAALGVSGTTGLSGVSVVTTGAQTFTGAATLGTDNALTASLVTFGATLDGAHALGITGDAVFDGRVGATAALASLGISGTSVLNGLGVSTTGVQDYAGAATLGTDNALTASLVTFGATVDGAHALGITGNAVFDGAVGSATQLAALNVTGTTGLDGTSVATTGAQTYTGAATLGTDNALTASLVTFGNTVDGAQSLGITGNAVFDGKVGSAAALASLSVSGTSGLDGLSVATTGSQTYTGAATLGTENVLTASLVSFGATLDGAHALAITGDAVFDGRVGSATALTGLGVSGTVALDGASVTTSGTQTYAGAATLGTDNALAASLVTFGATVDGAHALGITGNAVFDGAVGATTALASIAVTGTSGLGGTSVATTGAQTYSGAATLGTDNALSASLVTFGATLDGAHALAVTGNAVFDGAVGHTAALAALSVSGTTGLDGTSVATTGSQTYTGAATLGTGNALTASLVTFGATVDGAHALGITGNAVFDGAVGSTVALASLSVSGTSGLDGIAVSTTGTQTYTGAATLGTDNTLTASLVTFGATLDGAQALAVAGNAVFDGAVGSTTALAALGVSGTTGLSGVSVVTTGAQTFTGAATLGTDNALSASLVTFGASLDGAHALGITGDAVFDGRVGGTAALASLGISGTSVLNGLGVSTTGVQDYAGAATLGTDNALTASLVTFGATVDGAHALGITGNAVFDGAVGSATQLAALNVTGTSGLDGTSVATTGAQTYTGAATLGTDNALAASLVTFGATLDGAHTLGITGNAAFDGAVGSVAALAAVDVTASTSLAGRTVTTTGTQTYNGAATLSTDNLLTASLVTFGTTLDGAHALAITGDAAFDGRVGSAIALTGLGVSGTAALDGESVTTSGAQTYLGAATLGTDNALAASLVTFNATIDGAHALAIAGDAAFDGTVGSFTRLAALGIDGTASLNGRSVATTGAQTYSGVTTLGTDNALSASLVTFGSTLNGAHALAIAGNAVFDGAAGATTPLTALSVSADTVLNGGSVTTAGRQTYTGATTLDTDNALTASLVTFGATLDGAHALSIVGNAAFDGAVGSTAALASLSVSGTSGLDGTSVTTTGAQAYKGAATLGTDNTLTASLVTFGATLDGAQRLGIAGNAVFDGKVGANSGLAALSITGTTGLDGTTIATTGIQSYTGAATLGTDNTLSASLVTFGTTLDGAHKLAVAGDARFDGVVGGSAALSAVTVSGTSALDGTEVATAGAQNYGGAVSLGTDDKLAASLVTFDATLDGSRALDITGNAVFDGKVGASAALASLEIKGETALDGLGVATTGNQTYRGATTLGTDNALAASLVTFGATLDGAHALAIAGNAVFGGVTGGNRALTQLAVTGTTTLGTDVTTVGTQDYAGAVTLTADPTLTGSTMTFGSTVNGAQQLAIAGNAVFDGTVGNTAALASLSVSGTSMLAGTAVTTTGNQSYAGAATLGTDDTLSGKQVTFAQTIDGAHALSISGNAVLDGATGAETALASLTIDGAATLSGGSVTATGTQDYAGAVTLGSDNALAANTVVFGASVAGPHALSVAGTTVIDGGLIATGGSQTYNGAIELGSDTSLTGTGIAIAKTVDSTGGAAHSLQAQAGTGILALQGSIGTGQILKSIQLAGNSVAVTGNVTLAASGLTLLQGKASITLGGGTTTFRSRLVVIDTSGVQPLNFLAPFVTAAGSQLPSTYLAQLVADYPRPQALAATRSTITLGDLVAPTSTVLLAVNTGIVSGTIDVLSLGLVANGVSATLAGSVDGVSGQAAAQFGVASIGPAKENSDNNYRFDSCAIGSPTCVVVPTLVPILPQSIETFEIVQDQQQFDDIDVERLDTGKEDE